MESGDCEAILGEAGHSRLAVSRSEGRSSDTGVEKGGHVGTEADIG